MVWTEQEITKKCQEICALIAAIICLASKNGKQAARLSSLKRELESISRAQELASQVYTFGDDEARRKLNEVATKYSKDKRNS